MDLLVGMLYLGCNIFTFHVMYYTVAQYLSKDHTKGVSRRIAVLAAAGVFTYKS